MPKLLLSLVDLADTVIRAKGKEIDLETDSHSWADLANLRIYWYQGRFECTLTLTEFGPTLYGDPPENEIRETVETASFVKIRDVAEWANRHGVNLAKIDRVY